MSRPWRFSNGERGAAPASFVDEEVFVTDDSAGKLGIQRKAIPFHLRRIKGKVEKEDGTALLPAHPFDSIFQQGVPRQLNPLIDPNYECAVPLALGIKDPHSGKDASNRTC
jgi:hypothetical protein